MTLIGPTFPLTEEAALTHLTDALGSNYGGSTDEGVLKRALSVDGVAVGAEFHVRPWFTAARLIEENTDYEVAGGLVSQINRKLRSLKAKQRQMDAMAGILHLLPSMAEDWGQVPSGSAPVEAVFSVPIDARPFRTLTTESGATIKCAPPKLNPLSLGVSGQPGGVVTDNATHTIPVYVALGNPPADLVDNALVTVDVEVGSLQAFRVLRNGIDKQAGVWKLYVRTEEIDDGYEP